MRWHSRSAVCLLSLFCEPIRVIATNTLLSESSSESWNLTEKPNTNDTTSNFIFETVNSLLQRWPNTRYRNGHTIVPVTMPIGTLLYHGTNDPEVPKAPEWLSVDPEHSYLFCGVETIYPPSDVSGTKRNSTPYSGCWHLTFVATQPLKLLYFDGSSAAKLKGGPLDSQDLLTWGGIREDWSSKERERIDTLCEWGKKYNLDGFVRMEMDFEVMFCNFTQGLNPVNVLNLTDSLPLVRGPGRPSPGMVPFRIRLLEAAGWSNRFPGDQRMKVDYSRLISFYDNTIFPNLHLQRLGQERWDHRLKGINESESDALFVRVKEVLTEQDRESTIDWETLLHVVTSRYADRLELLQYLLKNATIASEADRETALWSVHRFISAMLTPYTVYDSVPPEEVTGNDHEWATPVFKYCATTHTQYIETSLITKLSSSERLLLNAVREVTKEICRVLVVIWAEGKELLTNLPRAGVEGPKLAAQHLDDAKTYSYSHQEDIKQNLLVRWNATVSDLISWLDWSEWVRCRPQCSYEEMCYLPTWPYFLHHESRVDNQDWNRPQPLCVRRFEPYHL